MSGMRRSAGAFAMMAAMASLSEHDYTERKESNRLTDEDKMKLKEIHKNKRLKKKGLNEYFYEDNVVYALNQKNADRKAKNKGFL